MFGDALSMIQTVQTNLMSASHITEGVDRGLRKIICSCKNEQCFRRRYKRFEDMKDFTDTEKKQVSNLKPDFNRHGWHLYYKERLCVSSAQSARMGTQFKIVWELWIHENSKQIGSDSMVASEQRLSLFKTMFAKIFNSLKSTLKRPWMPYSTGSSRPSKEYGL